MNTDRTDKVKEEVRTVFSKGTVRTRKNTKEILQEVYNRNGIVRKAKATDLGIFDIRYKPEAQKDNGKTVNLLRIL